jgi:hypothetical protein
VNFMIGLKDLGGVTGNVRDRGDSGLYSLQSLLSHTTNLSTGAAFARGIFYRNT